jgi:NADH-quinone oxidoreductase subunit L
MLDIKTLLILIPALPLTATLITAALGKRVLRQRSHLPAVTAVALSFLASILLVFQVQEQIDQPAGHAAESGPTRLGFQSSTALFIADPLPKAIGYEQVINLWRWANLGGGIDVTLRADPLTAAMLAIVTCISTLVAIYSIGYMHDDPGYWRFFTYISLFVFSMTMLVSASNFVVLYVFWEMVGLCSYLLIGFWFDKPAAAAAGKKAFLVTRLGDCGFLLGLFLIWTTYGTLNFHDTWADGRLVMGVFGQTRLASVGPFVGGGVATAIALLLLAGACGKSAQFPLHVWLPDAMEGPTPVSALIHAATMVTAGVYLIARCTPLMAASPAAQCVVAIIGGVTALLGAIIAITQTDLKRILAYSTISHLGYMFLALGTGTLIGVTAAMFHLLTHAFFKALLFLGAGSVMHAMGGVIDVRRLGGLRHRMPVTHATFLIGCLAIAGVFPFAGFWSKDAILLALQHHVGKGNFGEIYETLFDTAMLGILLIDFYMFRPFFLTFYGPERIPREAGRHAHESPGTMTVPLMILAFGATVVGAYFQVTRGFAQFLAATPSLAYLPAEAQPAAAEATEHIRMAVTSTVITAVGIGAAAVIYLGTRNGAARLAGLMNIFGLYSLSYGKFFFDPLYTLLVVWPLLGIARLAAAFDQYVIDALVDFCGGLPKLVGESLRPAQNGLVQFYALMMMIGLFVLLGSLLM